MRFGALSQDRAVAILHVVREWERRYMEATRDDVRRIAIAQCVRLIGLYRVQLADLVRRDQS